MRLEENDELPNLHKFINADLRQSAASAYELKKLIAPTRPHNAAPDQYPMLETLSGLILKPIDSFFDLFKNFPNQEVVKKIKQAS